ncbi:MAG: hypothetical protein OFPI_37490 [Osedax symbiont Rs2]|nr:MAG: hypothetical protein OFPI_37490 [Osedax symbiont Rs2]
MTDNTVTPRGSSDDECNPTAQARAVTKRHPVDSMTYKILLLSPDWSN